MIEVLDEEVEVVSNGEEARELLAKGENLTIDDAQNITQAIRSTSEALWWLLYVAHSTKSYQQEGYKTWKSYIEDNMTISLSAANALVTQGTVIDAITSSAPEGVNVHFTQAQSRDLKKVLDKVSAAISEQTKDKTPEEAEEIIEEIVSENLQAIKEEKEALKAQKAAEEQRRLEAEQMAYESAADQIIAQAQAQKAGDTSLDEESDAESYEYTLDEDDDEQEPPQYELNRNAVILRDLYSTISKSEALPTAKEALEVIPQERIGKTHTELSELEQKIHDIRVALEERYGKSILSNTMSH
mgnify:FL=1|jgi:hypothetical protein